MPLITELHQTISQTSTQHKSMLNTLKEKVHFILYNNIHTLNALRQVMSYDEQLNQFESNQMNCILELESRIEQNQSQQVSHSTLVHTLLL